MNIAVKVVPHKQQRYETTGDWLLVNDTLEVRVSYMTDWRYEVLIAVHEIVEAVLCRLHDVTFETVNAFDVAYEDGRKDPLLRPCDCVATDESEPGDDIHAPYHSEHQWASMLERFLAFALGVKWDAYEAANLELYT